MAAKEAASNQENNQHPTPEWEAEHWVVVDPSIWPSYTRRACDLRPVHQDLLLAFQSLGADVTVLRAADQPVDVWIKDWGSVAGRQFIFRPAYARSLYPPAAVARALTGLNQHLPRIPVAVDLVLDGGNLVHDGTVAVITDRVLTDNPTLSRRQIRALISEIGFNKVAIIPAEPADPLGHADGVLKFLPHDVLLINDYEHTPLDGYGRSVKRTLERSLPHKEIIPFPSHFTDQPYDGLNSAVGLYVNLIVTGRGIILPVFGLPLDTLARDTLAHFTSLPVHPVLTAQLARLGGGLSCVALHA